MYLRKLLPQNYLLYMAQEPCDAPDGSNTCLPEGSVHPLSRSPTMAFRLPSSLLTGNANSQQRGNGYAWLTARHWCADSPLAT